MVGIRVLSFLALVSLLSPEAASTPVGKRAVTWTVAGTRYRYDPASRDLTATCAGRTVRPLAGFGPVFLYRDREHPLEEAAVRLMDAERRKNDLLCHYRTERDGEVMDYTVALSAVPGGLKLRARSGTPRCARMRAGRTIGAGRWFRFGYTRNAEPYGQPFWPRVAWLPDEGLFVTATWDMAASSGTSWDAPDQRFRGQGDFDAGLEVVYTPRTDGTRRPLDETLILRVGRDLWRILPMPAQKPSIFQRELAAEVFLDVWGGTARETEYLLRHLSAVTLGQARFYTIFENWQAGGFDALLPDSLLMPDYPPNPGIGSIEDFQRLSAYARTMGHFGLRTNYVYLRPGSPSVRAGRARPALGADGKPKWHTRPVDWLALARRQEAEIQRLFQTNASFTDQMTSGGGPWSYTDFDARQPGASAMRESMRQQRQLARLIQQAHRGPLGSETNIDEQLMGEFVDAGDFGIYDGYHRAFTPEFKLRRLHHLTTFHGMGLMYRYFEMPPFPAFSGGKTTYLTDPAQYDDYRAAEVLYGNGGYLFYYPGMPWDYVLTECMLVGTLQKHYALQPVRNVQYWHGGRWVSLLQLVAAGIDPLPVPWAPQPEGFRRVHVTYANGLQIVVNRMNEPFTVRAGRTQVLLPRSGWVAWTPNDRLLAYSAFAPGTRHRVDFIRDEKAGLQYLNPRRERVMGQSQPTLWLNGEVVARLDPATGDAVVRGRSIPYRVPRPVKRTRLDFRFHRDVQGWTGQSDLGPLRIVDGALKADIVGDDPYMNAPSLDLAPDSVRTIVVRMRVTCGTFGQLYFQAQGSAAGAEEMCVRYPVTPGPAWQEIRIPVGGHPLWKGHRIVGLRLDPEHGASPGTVEIAWIRGE